MTRQLTNNEVLLDSAIESIDALAIGAREEVLQSISTIRDHIEWHLNDIAADEFYAGRGVEELLADEEQMKLFVRLVADKYAYELEQNAISHLEEVATEYEENEYNRYCAELGWEDWMELYTTAEDGEECTEEEIATIDAIIDKAWDNIHGEEWEA